MRILLWYRNDLRLHDHEPLYRALTQGAQVFPLYCFDPRHFSATAFGFPKTGAYRAQFLQESVADLRQSFRALQADLLVRHGKPEDIIPDLVKQLAIEAVYWHSEVTSEERAVEAALEEKLDHLGVKVKHFWGSTLYHPDNLPFPIEQVPELFTQFRKRVEKEASISPTFPTPSRVVFKQEAEPGELPTLQDLGLAVPVGDPRAVLPFVGGETSGLQRLQHYLWEGDHLKTYKETRNGLLGGDYSSKFSPWLALGCLSPRRLYEAVQHYEESRVRNDSTYWLV
ncbi:MAG TPA: DASH family cryptochrome, partial [Leptolyngbyaceae cyanobacterium]